MLIYSTISYADQYDPNFCYLNGESPKSCGRAQIFNCPLERCVTAAENEDFHEEYKKCEEAESPNECKSNLKGLHSELDELQKEFSNAMKSDDSSAQLAKLYNAGVGATALYGLYAVYKSEAAVCPGTYTIPMAGAAVAMMGFMDSQSDQSESIKKQLKEHVKKQNDFYAKGGWSKTSEVQGLKTQIQYLKQIEMMSKQSMNSHKSHRNYYTIIGSAAAACTATTFCVLADPCVLTAIGLAAGGVVLESIAYNEGKRSYEATVDARIKAEKLLAKLEGLFDNGNKGNSTLEETSGTGQVANQNTQDIEPSSNQNGNSQTGEQAEGGLVNFDTQVSRPCVGKDLTASSSSCKNPMSFSIPVPDSNIGRAVNKKLNFNEAASAMSSFAKGNYESLNKSPFGSEKMGATGQAVFRKVAQRALEVNKKLKPATKKTLTQIKNGNSEQSFVDQVSKMNPVAATANAAKSAGIRGLGSRLGIDKGLLYNKMNDKQGKAQVVRSGGKNLETKEQSYNSFPNLSELEGMSVGEGEFGDGFSVEEELANLENLGEGELKESHGIIHADQKISIFKIITNRYNYMRVRKDFGGK